MVEEMMLVGVAVLIFALLYELLEEVLNWAIYTVRSFF